MKKLILLCSLAFILFAFSKIDSTFAEDRITILISGQSHSTLYPCHCPMAPMGGVARRAAAIKNIKAGQKDILLLEAGGSFSSGNYDQASQTTEIDKKRTDFYMQSLVKMGYDVFLVSSDEFNFGQDFLNEIIAKYQLSYLSANLAGNFQPYIIKEISKKKIAIIGLTDKRVEEKTRSIYIDPKEKLSQIVKELKNNKKADIIVVLSYLGDKQSKEVLETIEGIDIWVSSNNPFRSFGSEKVKNTTFIIPAWETRTLTQIDLTFKKDKTVSIETKNIKLTKEIADDPEIKSIIPECFTNYDCKKPGFLVECKEAATTNAKCILTPIKPIKLTIIQPKECKTCNIEETLNKIKEVISNVEVEYLVEDVKNAKKIINDLKIKMLPVYLFDKSVYEEEVLAKIKKISKEAGNYYLVEPGFSGVSYFTNREKISNKLDVFFDLSTKDIVAILDVLQKFKSKNPNINISLNFLAIEDPKEGILAKGGKYEVEEYLRSACINKYYPDKLQYYLPCRLSDIETSWWDDCVVKFGIDPAKIKVCAQSEEGKLLLRGLIKLTQELEVVFGPTFVINNQEVFSSNGVPTVEELEKIFK